MTVSELEKLIQSYGKDIYSFCIQITGNQIEADELYQDTFLQIMQKLEQIDETRNPKSYLLSVAIRLWKNKRRKLAWRNRIAPVESLTEEKADALTETSSLEDDVIKGEQERMVRKLIKQLPQTYQIPLVLLYMEEQSVEEISRIIQCPKGTVKSRLYKARQLLKDKLIQCGINYEQ